MSRFVSTSMQALSSGSLVAYRMLANIGVTSSTLYCCTGNQFIYALGNTYSPVGPLGAIEAIVEESDNFPRDIRMQLAAVNSSYLYEPMRESMFNREVRLYRTFLKPGDFSQVSSPELMWFGKTSEVNIKFDEEGAYYELRAESSLRRTARVAYFNRETQRALVDSSDTFFDHIDKIPLFKAQWGGNPTTFGGKTGGGAEVPTAPRFGPNPRYNNP